MFGLIGFGLALFSLLISLFILVSIRLYMSKLKPVVSRAMSIVGNLGKAQQMENADISEIEQAVQGGVMEMITQKYPEVALVLGYLEENHPDIFEKITDNPTVIIRLYQKYAPMLKQFMGKGEKKNLPYDV